MAEILSKPVGEFNVGEAFAIGVSKSLTEAMLNPVIGNGNFLSGSIKMTGAYFLPKIPHMKGKIGKTVASGLAVDGVEDIIHAVVNWATGNTGTADSGAII